MRVRPMERHELDVLVEWAAGEGWNPGRDDADVFWSTDPAGFVVAEVDGEMVGGGSIVSYGGTYGFMGFFIVRPDLRGRGLGRELWLTRRSLLLDRLDDGAAIEMDGVFAMERFYAAGGFAAQHRDLRYAVVATASPASGDRPKIEVVDLASVPFELVEAYDRHHFAAPRPDFLRQWIARPGGHALGVVEEGRCRGELVVRPARDGFRVGPLFADDADIAEALFTEAMSRVAGAEVSLDVPERNADAMALAARHGMREVFGCARMTLGPPPPLPWNQIYGVTSFELG